MYQYGTKTTKKKHAEIFVIGKSYVTHVTLMNGKINNSNKKKTKLRIYRFGVFSVHLATLGNVSQALNCNCTSK